MRIRLHDTPARVETFAAALRQAFEVTEESSDYASRGVSVKVRRYLDIAVPGDQDRLIGAVLAEVGAERRRQLAEQGVQHRVDGTDELFAAEAAKVAGARWEWHESDSPADWTTVLLQQVYQALAETDPAGLRAELVHVAAMAAAWIEDIDHRST